MSTDDPTPAGSRAVGTLHPEPVSTWRRWSVLLPALAFLCGLALGGAVIGAATRDGGSTGAVASGATATPSPSRSSAGPPEPGPCAQAAARAGEAYDLLEKGFRAARDLDASALADLVQQVQQQRPEVEALIQQCQHRAGTAGASPSPVPSASS